MKIKGQRQAVQKKTGPPMPPKRKTVILDKDTNNSHINHINTVFTLAKTKPVRVKKLTFSLSFFEKKKKNLNQILTALVNGEEPRKIFVTFEDFDFHEFEEIGIKRYSQRLTHKIKNLNSAIKYTKDILKQLD